MSARDEIHSQIVGELAGGTFPINTAEELLAAFPECAATTCKYGDLKVTAGDAVKLLKTGDFPFKDARQVADLIVKRAGL